MLFDKTLSSRPLSSPRHSDEAPPPSENASDAPPARPRAVSDDEKRPATPPEKTPPAPPAVSPAAPPNRKRGRQWAGLDESDDDEDDDDD